jgi:CubicO group peptidase (beta-lactamase class C family)
MRRVRNTILIAIISFGSALCHAQQIYFPPVTGNGWEIATPQSLGWCDDKTDTLYNFLELNNTKAFIVLQDGRIVLEKYFGTFSSDSVWYWASAGKTLTAMLTGIAGEEGYLSIDLPVSTYLGQGWSSCPPEKESAITVRNQLTMTTGLNDMVSDPDCTSPPCLQYLADAGTRWAYHNAPYTILDQVISNATGTDFNSYYNSRIRNKTGMDGIWLNIDFNHVYFSTARSMARYGLLLLANGNWNGQAVIQDTAYLTSMTNTSQNLNLSYGYLTWLNGKESFMLPQSQFVFPGAICPDAPDDMYAALGKNGQLINVVPSMGLVLIRMGNAPDTQVAISNVFNNLIWQYLNAIICNDNSISESLNKSTMFSVFPNPASDEIHIIPVNTSSVYETLLFDVTGQLKVFSRNENTMDVSNIDPGIYILIVTQNGFRKEYKISIVR